MVPPLHVQVEREATLHAVPALRRVARSWAEDCALDDDLAEDVVLAVDEAVTNAVEHAYPGQVGVVRLALSRGEGGEVTVTVEDEGTWRPPSDPGFRGRGLLLIDALADHAGVTATGAGTTVAMRWTARSRRRAASSAARVGRAE